MISPIVFVFDFGEVFHILSVRRGARGKKIKRSVLAFNGTWDWLAIAFGCNWQLLAAGQRLNVIEKLHKKWQISQLKFGARAFDLLQSHNPLR